MYTYTFRYSSSIYIIIMLYHYHYSYYYRYYHFYTYIHRIYICIVYIRGSHRTKIHIYLLIFCEVQVISPMTVLLRISSKDEGYTDTEDFESL